MLTISFGIGLVMSSMKTIRVRVRVSVRVRVKDRTRNVLHEDN